MNINKTMLAAAIATTVAAGSVVGISKASAHFNGNNNQFATDLAQRFNLNVGDVESFLEEKHQQREQEMQQKQSERLQSLVDEGKITPDQKTALESKLSELHSSIEDLRNQNLSREDFRTKMKELHDSFKSWASDQGIDLSSVGPFGPRGFGGPMRGQDMTNN